MTRSMKIPTELFDSRKFGFAQVTVTSTPLGQAIHISGQVAWDSNGSIVGAGDIGRQLEKSLENLGVALASVGAGLDDVGSLRIYIRLHHGDAISRALKAVFVDNPPCTTWIGVTSLARDEFLVEIEPSIVFLPRTA